jgi:hypothetical protein
LLEAPGVEHGSGDVAGECRSALESGFGEESAACEDSRGTASALENGGESGRCTNVASGPTRAERLALVDAAIIALDAGEIEVAKARFQALAEAVQSRAAVHRLRCSGDASSHPVLPSPP